MDNVTLQRPRRKCQRCIERALEWLSILDALEEFSERVNGADPDVLPDSTQCSVLEWLDGVRDALIAGRPKIAN